MFKISPSDWLTVSLRRWISYYSLFHGLCKAVTRSSFDVIRRHKASGGYWMFRHCVKHKHIQTSDNSGRTGPLRPTPINMNHTTCNMMDIPNLRRFEVYLEAFQLLNKTSNHMMYHLSCDLGISLNMCSVKTEHSDEEILKIKSVLDRLSREN